MIVQRRQQWESKKGISFVPLPLCSPCDFLAKMYKEHLLLSRLQMATLQDNISFICWVDDDVSQVCEQTLWRDKGEWKSCNRTIEAFVRSGPRCVSITVHLLITPSNPKAWLSIVGYSSHDLNIELEGARLILAVKPMWGLISWLDLTSRAIGFKGVSDDDIQFLAPASPCQTRAAITSARSGTHLDDGNGEPWPQNRSHYSSQVETWHSFSEALACFAASRLLAVYSQQTCRLQKGNSWSTSALFTVRGSVFVFASSHRQ